MQILFTQGLKGGLVLSVGFPRKLSLPHSGILPLLYHLAYVEIRS